MRRIATHAVLSLLFATNTFAAVIHVTSSADFGPGTLRQAILDANGKPGKDTISGNSRWVRPLSALPPITEAVSLSFLYLDGRDAGDASGLLFAQTHGTYVSSVAVFGFEKNGVEVIGGSRNAFYGLEVGVEQALGNGASGIHVDGGSGHFFQMTRSGYNAEGITTVGTSDITFAEAAIFENKGAGLRAIGSTVFLTTAECRVTCVSLGVESYFNDGAGFHFIRSTLFADTMGASQNGQSGAIIDAGAAHITHSTFDANGLEGIVALNGARVKLVRATASGNALERLRCTATRLGLPRRYSFPRFPIRPTSA